MTRHVTRSRPALVRVQLLVVLQPPASCLPPSSAPSPWVSSQPSGSTICPSPHVWLLPGQLVLPLPHPPLGGVQGCMTPLAGFTRHDRVYTPLWFLLGSPAAMPKSSTASLVLPVQISSTVTAPCSVSASGPLVFFFFLQHDTKSPDSSYL